MSDALEDRDQKEWRAFMPSLNALLKDWDATERKAGDISALCYGRCCKRW